MRRVIDFVTWTPPILKLGDLGLTEAPKDEEWDAKEVHLMNNKLFKLPAEPRCPVLVKLFLQGNTDLMEIPLSFFLNMPMLQVLDLSHTSLKSLPSTVGRLVALQEFFLRDCQLLMELPPEIGELTNLKVLDVKGTKLIRLPWQIGELINLECLKVSFDGHANHYIERNNMESIIPCQRLSELTQLKELSINVDPEGKWWADEVKAIMNDLGNIRYLESLQLSIPRADILQQFLDLRRAWDRSVLYSSLSNFSLSISHREEYIMPRVPHGLLLEFQKLQKYLNFTNGEGNIDDIAKILKHAGALFLHCHWTAERLSEFTIDALDRLNFCLVAECNEMVTFIDGDDYYQVPGVGQPVLQSLQYLCVHHMKNLETVWKGPTIPGCLSHLKMLALHVCPELTTVLTKELLANLKNLTVIIIDSCPKITSLVTLEPWSIEPDHCLPSLKKITLLNLPELLNISGGICIAPNLKRMVIYGCPKLEHLSIREVSSKFPDEIKGESEWWEALKWPTDLASDSDYWNCVFIPFGSDDDLMDELEAAADSLQQFMQVEDTELQPKYKIMVFKVDNYNNVTKKEVMKSVSSLSGVDSICFSMENKLMTVTGTIDPLLIKTKLRKFSQTNIISAGQQNKERLTHFTPDGRYHTTITRRMRLYWSMISQMIRTSRNGLEEQGEKPSLSSWKYHATVFSSLRTFQTSPAWSSYTIPRPKEKVEEWREKEEDLEEQRVHYLEKEWREKAYTAPSYTWPGRRKLKVKVAKGLLQLISND